MADDGLKLIMNRNAFYRDNYRRIIMGLLLMILINLGLIGIIGYLVTHRPMPQYFATTSSGQILPLYPLSAPMVSKAEILQWANTAATASFTFSWVSWRKELQEASNYFTPDGWKDFQDALKTSNNLQTVLDKQLVVSAVATGTPVITQEGVVDGRYSWNVQIPLLLSYQSSSETNFSQPVIVTMLITRVPVLNNPRGIAIAQFYASSQSLSPTAQGT